MRIRHILFVLCAQLGSATSIEAQFSYTIENVQQEIYQPNPDGFYRGGFTATLLLRNINTYEDADIIGFRQWYVFPSGRTGSYCSSAYDPGYRTCWINGSNTLTPHGAVQTGTIPFASGPYIYSPGVSADCLYQCSAQLFSVYGGLGVLGCQGPAPVQVEFYSGRTCDADGFTGAMAMGISFGFYAHISDPPVTFDETDLLVYANSYVGRGPNAFVTPEPSSFLLSATGLGVVGAAMRRRRRRSTATQTG